MQGIELANGYWGVYGHEQVMLHQTSAAQQTYRNTRVMHT